MNEKFERDWRNRGETSNKKNNEERIKEDKDNVNVNPRPDGARQWLQPGMRKSWDVDIHDIHARWQWKNGIGAFGVGQGEEIRIENGRDEGRRIGPVR